MENQFNHTPGPWSVNPAAQYYNGNKAYEINFGNDGECVAEVVHSIEDANLIAAAKDLLEACQAFMELFTDSDMRPEDESYEVAGIIQEAINKALGKEAIPCEK